MQIFSDFFSKLLRIWGKSSTFAAAKVKTI